MKRFLKGFLCGMLTTSMMLVVALTVGQFSGYIDLGAAWNRTDQDSTMKREVKQKASTIEKYIDAYYLDDINKDKMENSIYKGIVNGLEMIMQNTIRQKNMRRSWRRLVVHSMGLAHM